jgi:hypothetical protein
LEKGHNGKKGWFSTHNGTIAFFGYISKESDIANEGHIFPMSFPWVLGEMVQGTCVKQPNDGFGKESGIIHVYLEWSFVLLLKEHSNLHESLV